MPTYQYRCETCDHRQTENHGASLSPLVSCEQCGGLMEKIITSAPVVLNNIQDDSKSADTSNETDTNNDSDHQCHSGCALHRMYPDSPVSSDSE